MARKASHWPAKQVKDADHVLMVLRVSGPRSVHAVCVDGRRRIRDAFSRCRASASQAVARIALGIVGGNQAASVCGVCVRLCASVSSARRGSIVGRTRCITCCLVNDGAPIRICSYYIAQA